MLVEVQGLRRVLIAGGGSSVRVVVRICFRVGVAPAALTELGDEGTECWSKFKDYVAS